MVWHVKFLFGLICFGLSGGWFSWLLTVFFVLYCLVCCLVFLFICLAWCVCFVWCYFVWLISLVVCLVVCIVVFESDLSFVLFGVFWFVWCFGLVAFGSVMIFWVICLVLFCVVFFFLGFWKCFMFCFDLVCLLVWFSFKRRDNNFYETWSCHTQKCQQLDFIVIIAGRLILIVGRIFTGISQTIRYRPSLLWML